MPAIRVATNVFPPEKGVVYADVKMLSGGRKGQPFAFESCKAQLFSGFCEFHILW